MTHACRHRNLVMNGINTEIDIISKAVLLVAWCADSDVSGKRPSAVESFHNCGNSPTSAGSSSASLCGTISQTAFKPVTPRRSVTFSSNNTTSVVLHFIYTTTCTFKFWRLRSVNRWNSSRKKCSKSVLDQFRIYCTHKAFICVAFMISEVNITSKLPSVLWRFVLCQQAMKHPWFSPWRFSETELVGSMFNWKF